MSAPPALQIHAGPKALARLRSAGWQARDVTMVPAAAGGPKGLVLLPLDRWLFGDWLAGPRERPLHLLGASIGAWRMACACRADAVRALDELAEDYITQAYEHAPGRPPTAEQVSRGLSAMLRQRLGAPAAEILAHPDRRLHVFTSRGRHLLAREGRWRTPLGYAGAFLANAAGRRALGAWIERVVFSDPRNALPVPLSDLRSRQAVLGPHNLALAVQASCSIPFWLQAVHDVPGGPPGAYWDGGITDYHLHLDYAAAGEGWVLYPHFQAQVVPGWMDKAWRRRHRPTPGLDNLVVLSPHPAWVAGLPQGKLPDRSDFKAYGEDEAARQRAWRRALAESQRLADALAEVVSRQRVDEVLPLP